MTGPNACDLGSWLSPGSPSVVPLGEVAALALNAAALTFFTWLSIPQASQSHGGFRLQRKEIRKARNRWE